MISSLKYKGIIMKDFIDPDKMTKKMRKEHYKKHRTSIDFNTGTRVHKDPLNPDRAERKRRFREYKEKVLEEIDLSD